MPKIEVLTFEGCPHAAATLELVREVARQLAPGAPVRELRIESEDEARREGFLGSPSVRVDGRDLEDRIAKAPRLACRLYGASGVPPRWIVEAGLLRALRPRHVLFLCVANSARSQLAEGIARSLAPAGVAISSAGSAPTAIRPEALQVLREIGVDASRQRAKPISDVDLSSVDAVITLCSEEACPSLPLEVRRLHWELPDPAREAGSTERRLAAFRRVRDELRARLVRLFS